MLKADGRVAAGVAAGHPATAEVGLRVLAAGGGAADAAVGAMLAACVAESILAGIGGGGFATYYDHTSGAVTCLDFFCAVPGRDGDTKADRMWPIAVTFGEVPLDYLIGGASVAVPGVPAGAGAVHGRWGRLPWHDVIAPAISLAASGAIVPNQHAVTLAAIAPALLPGEGASVYAPGGQLLSGGDRLFHPGLAQALTALADEGPAAFYTGSLAGPVVAAVRDQGGILGPQDLAAYRVRRPSTARAGFGAYTVAARADLNQTIATIASLPPDLDSLPRDERTVALARSLLAYGRDRVGDTTNISVVDPDGNACVITLTLGLGSGVWVPGTGVHLNSMLGEGELFTGDRPAGTRVASMMCPLVVTDPGGGLVLAAGSAGASRIRTALVSTLVGVLVDGGGVGEVIAAPRVHAVAGGEPGLPPVAHAEPGRPEDELDALSRNGFLVQRWRECNHYFGGVSAVGRLGAAGDPRRGGVGLLLPAS